MDILNSYISCAYNVPTKSKLTSTIVRFTRNCVRNELYMARKDIKKKLNNKQFINEDLTLKRSKLLHALQRDEIIHRNAWSYNGNIYCSTKQNQDVIKVIKSHNDLIKHLDYNIYDANSYFPIPIYIYIYCFLCSQIFLIIYISYFKMINYNYLKILYSFYSFIITFMLI